jgi:hypothetical protein
MKAYTVLTGFLIGIGAMACSESDVVGTCLDSAYCQDIFCPAAEPCPNGRVDEPYCGENDRCVCPSCLSGTGGTGGGGGTGGTVNPGACADCVGTDVGPPGEPNTVVSCAPTNDENLCSCLDGMGTSHDVYLSPGGCY